MSDIITVSGITSQTKSALIIFSITLVVFLIILGIMAKRISDSIRDAAQNNGRINQYLAAVPEDKIGTIQAVYQNTRKSLGMALILASVGGLFGLHRIYLGKARSAAAMFLLFWTGIPAVVSLFDLTVLPRIVSEFNLNVAESLYNQIAAPKIE